MATFVTRGSGAQGLSIVGLNGQKLASAAQSVVGNAAGLADVASYLPMVGVAFAAVSLALKKLNERNRAPNRERLLRLFGQQGMRVGREDQIAELSRRLALSRAGEVARAAAPLLCRVDRLKATLREAWAYLKEADASKGDAIHTLATETVGEVLAYVLGSEELDGWVDNGTEGPATVVLRLMGHN